MGGVSEDERIRVLVTRSSSSGGKLRTRLKRAGFDTLNVPTIEFRACEGPWFTDLFFPQQAWDWAVFTSSTTLGFIEDALAGQSFEELARVAFRNVAAVGRGTAARLEELGCSDVFVPKDFSAEGLVELLDEHAASGQTVVIPRAREARELLPSHLQRQGLLVDKLFVYESVKPVESEATLHRLKPGDVDVITFASSKTIEHFVSMMDPELNWLLKVPCACIGPITRRTALSYGFNVLDEPRENSFDGLTRLVVDWSASGQ